MGRRRQRCSELPIAAPSVRARWATAHPPAAPSPMDGGLACTAIAGGSAHAALMPGARSRRVVGRAIGRSIDARLAAEALRSAIAERRPFPGSAFRADRGSRGAPEPHRGIPAERGFSGSMGRSGNPCEFKPVRAGGAFEGAERKGRELHEDTGGRGRLPGGAGVFRRRRHRLAPVRRGLRQPPPASGTGPSQPCQVRRPPRPRHGQNRRPAAGAHSTCRSKQACMHQPTSETLPMLSSAGKSGVPPNEDSAASASPAGHSRRQATTHPSDFLASGRRSRTLDVNFPVRFEDRLGGASGGRRAGSATFHISHATRVLAKGQTQCAHLRPAVRRRQQRLGRPVAADRRKERGHRGRHTGLAVDPARRARTGMPEMRELHCTPSATKKRRLRPVANDPLSCQLSSLRSSVQALKVQRRRTAASPKAAARPAPQCSRPACRRRCALCRRPRCQCQRPYQPFDAVDGLSRPCWPAKGPDHCHAERNR